jgi:rod shape-determining protein MreC
MMVFACISIALLLVDSHMRTLTTVRRWPAPCCIRCKWRPCCRATPGVGDYFSTLSSLEKQVRELRRQQILRRAAAGAAAGCRKCAAAPPAGRAPAAGQVHAGRMLYDARDVNSRKIILDRGTARMTLGLPVIDNQGVVGQVTRVFPFTPR